MLPAWFQLDLIGCVESHVWLRTIRCGQSFGSIRWLLESAKVVREGEGPVPGPLAHGETSIHGKEHRVWRPLGQSEVSGEQYRGAWSLGAVAGDRLGTSQMTGSMAGLGLLEENMAQLGSK